MTQRLADRLVAARRRRFVGRSAELASWKAALEADTPRYLLFYIFGPGGIGKTTLLGEMANVCQQAGVTAHLVDARPIEPAPEPFTQALGQALGLPAGRSVFDALAQGRHALLLDTCERLEPLEAWLRDTFLPQLPEGVLVVMAGQRPLAPAWRADPGWQDLIHVVPLRNLSPDEGRAFLASHGLPDDQMPTVLGFTHGHPLALSLVTDVYNQRGGQSFQPDASPDIVRALLERFIQKVPGPAHRAALEACSLVRALTESLLATMLGTADAHDLFEWLRGLSFIESGVDGLFAHDLARDTLGRDLRWRHPDWYAELHKRARQHYVTRLQQSSGLAQQQALFDLIYLHRDNGVVKSMFEWSGGGQLRAEPIAPQDRVAVHAMVAQAESEASADWVDFWIDRQPTGSTVVRDAAGAVVGFMQGISLEVAAPHDREADPATRAAWHYLEAHAPLRGSETALCFRTWLARDTYQSVSAVQSLLFVLAVRLYLITTHLAFHFFACASPADWAPLFAYADLDRLTDADYEIERRSFGMFGHDWRLRPPSAWLGLLAERETSPTVEAAVSRLPSTPVVVLSADEFASAVRLALRDVAAPELLRGNPLLRSRLVLDRGAEPGDEAARATALARLVKRAAEPLLASPRDAKLYRALEATYFKPAVTQEQAAEQLDLPFSTYRRHLKAGVDWLIDRLWQQELGA